MGESIMPFDIYEPEEQAKPENSNVAQAIKGITGVAGRAFEGAVGAPGSLASIGTSLANALTGGRVGTYEEARQKYPYLPPTVDELRSATQRLTGQELEPESSTQEAIQNVAQKFGTGLSTGLGFVPNVAMSIGGEIAKQTAKKFGAGPNLQTAVEIGSELFLGSKLAQRGLEKLRLSSYDKLNNLSPAERTIKTAVPHTEKALKEIIHKSNLGLSTPGKEFAQRRAEEFVDKIQKGNISFEDFWEYTKSLNNLSYEATIPSGTKQYLEPLMKAARKDISELSKKVPVYKTLKTANEINYATNAAKEASQLINKRLDGLTVSDVTKSLIKSLILPAIGYGTSGKAAALVGGALTLGKKQYDFFKTLISNSSDAQKAYGNLIKYALQNNANGLDKAIKNFDRVLEKESKYEIYD
jgi:hypothetical protein